MEKTNTDVTTPGGNPVNLENPHSSESGLTDSGGDQPLFVDYAFRKSTVILRSPPQNTTDKVSLTNVTTPKTNETFKLAEERTKPLVPNYYEEWQKEIQAREALERTIRDLHSHIMDLEKKIQFLGEKRQDQVSTPTGDYHTDEEDLTQEIGWIEAKNTRNKKRKANNSPEIPSQNRNDDDAKVRQQNPTSGKTNKELQVKHTPPPIIVSKIDSFGNLRNIIQQTTSAECKYISYYNNEWKINVPDSDTYRKVTEALNREKVQWHTYEDKANRPLKVMARGLHHTCDEHEIVADLASRGYHILTAKNIQKKETIRNENDECVTQKRGLNLFMLTFDKQENIQNIYNIKSIIGLGVKIEPLRKNVNLIPQCKRCQAFNHTQKYCNREYACVKCAGKHPTSKCTMKREQAPTCINCKGDHPANYRGCPKAKAEQNKRNKLMKNRHQGQEGPANERQPEKRNERPQTKEKNEETKVTYSQIIKNVRTDEESSIKSMLNCILQRLEEQQKSLNALTNKINQIENSTKKKARSLSKNELTHCYVECKWHNTTYPGT